MFTLCDMYLTPGKSQIESMQSVLPPPLTDIEIQNGAGVVFQLPSGDVQHILRLYHVVDSHVGHPLQFQLNRDLLAHKSRRFI